MPQTRSPNRSTYFFRGNTPGAMRVRRAAPSVACLVMLSVMALQCSNRPTPATSDAYHLAVAQASARVPYAIDGWIGIDAPIIPAAAALLRPNVILSRAYRNPESGRRAKVLFVQCRDTRDMAGHAPPRCYPANGYTLEGRSPMTLKVDGRDIPGIEYRFAITTFNRSNQLIVYNFMIRPEGGIVPDESEVRELAAQSSRRYLGAAQMQIALELDRTLARDTAARREIYVSLLKGYRDLIDKVQHVDDIEASANTPAPDMADNLMKIEHTEKSEKSADNPADKLANQPTDPHGEKPQDFPAKNNSKATLESARSQSPASGREASIRSESL